MKLNALKAMIKEEYSAYTEQANAAPAAPAAPTGPGGPTPPPTGLPKVNVAPGDIDASGDEDSEETLRQIYDMLKAHFEGDDVEADDMEDDDMSDVDADDEGDDSDDDGDDDGDDDEKALQERFQKLANIIKG